MRYVLASASPRRRQLLKQIIANFEVIPATSEERLNPALSPEQAVCALAESKCGEVFAANPDALVIGCDTVVVFEGRILGKPHGQEDAVRTLTALSGRTHEVVTGVCVRYGDKKLTAYDCTRVRFNDLSAQFIRDYVKGGSPLDKAGSYGIQDAGVVKDFAGSYTNVVGLPVELTKNMVEEITK